MRKRIAAKIMASVIASYVITTIGLNMFLNACLKVARGDLNEQSIGD